MMKKIKRLSLILALILCILPFSMSAKAMDGFYLVGSFSNNELLDDYKMSLNSEGNYEYIFSNTNEFTQFRISDGENTYRSEGLNKGSSFLLKEKGSYKIEFNTEAILDNSNTRITRLAEKDYYVMGTMNLELNPSYMMKRVDYLKYEIELEVSEYSLIYISDGENEYHDLNGMDYVIAEAGRYLLELSLQNSNHTLKITKLLDNITDYYVLGSFNAYKMNEKSKMSYTDGSYSFDIDTTEVTSFYISDGENIYKNGKENYLLESFNSYEISFNLESKAVDIKSLSFYILNDDNNYSENENDKLEANLDNTSYLEYKKEIKAKAGMQLFVGNSDSLYTDNDNSFLIKEDGTYNVYFSREHLYDNKLNVKIEKLSSEIDTFYVLGSFNGYTMDENSLMEEKDSWYYLRVHTTDASVFYISDGENIYKNGKLDYTLDEFSSYVIYFNKDTKEVKIEAEDYYLLSADNNYQEDIGYIFDRNTDNSLYLEYKLSLSVDGAYQFIIGNSDIEFLNNDGAYLIKEKGKYTIYFSPNHNYENGTNVLVRKYKESNNSYFVMGSFNDYIESDDYKLSYNSDNEDYIEYTIELNLMKGDRFYIAGNDKKYYDPNGDELVIKSSASYMIYFSLEYDYGNGYHIYYKAIKNEEALESIIEINNKEDLISFINKANLDSFSTNLTVEIKNDIDMNGETINPIMVFSGVLNGNYHTISNFKLNTKVLGSEIGFIRRLLAGASVNSLILDYSLKIEENDTAVGGICGVSYGTIRGSSFKGSLNGISVVGGICGINKEDASIINCSSEGVIIARSFVGGICGINNGTINKSNNSASINRTSFSSNEERTVMNIGGIAGFNTNTILESFNQGPVGSDKLGGLAGGICGNSTGIIRDCYNVGKISGKRYIGGIVGYFADFKNNKSDDELYDKILKEIEDILKSHEDSEATPYKNEGDNNDKIISTITSSFNKGIVDGNSECGGIVGFSSSDGSKRKDSYSIKYCYNMGNITSKMSYSGGIAGNHKNGTISECYNSGIIEATDKDYAGGIAGYSNGLIRASFNTASVKGNSYVGGIAGFLNEANNCYSTSQIYPNGSFAGAISGSSNEIDDGISNNYYIYNGFGAFDNIDYASKGERVSREDLAAKNIMAVPLDFKYFMAPEVEGYPILRGLVELDSPLKDIFKEDMYLNTSFTCLLTFIDDNDDILYTRRVEYGSDFAMENMPKPKEKEGYYSKWDPSFDGKCITSDLIIRIIYTEIRTSIGSDSSSKPLGIIEGSFTPQTKFEIVKENKNYLGDNSYYKFLNSYKITINDDENDISLENMVMNLKASEENNLRVALIKDGRVIFIDYESNGDYIRFDLDGADEFMLVTEELYNINNPSFVRIITITVASTLAALVLIAGAVVVIDLGKRKKL